MFYIELSRLVLYYYLYYHSSPTSSTLVIGQICYFVITGLLLVENMVPPLLLRESENK